MEDEFTSVGLILRVAGVAEAGAVAGEGPDLSYGVVTDEYFLFSF